MLSRTNVKTRRGFVLGPDPLALHICITELPRFRCYACLSMENGIKFKQQKKKTLIFLGGINIDSFSLE